MASFGKWVEGDVGDITEADRRRAALFVVGVGRSVEERRMFLDMLGLGAGTEAVEG